jgi:hypothetical protein
MWKPAAGKRDDDQTRRDREGYPYTGGNGFRTLALSK